MGEIYTGGPGVSLELRCFVVTAHFPFTVFRLISVHGGRIHSYAAGDRGGQGHPSRIVLHFSLLLHRSLSRVHVCLIL